MGAAMVELGAVAALVALFLSPLVVVVLGVERVWREELLTYQAEAALVTTVREFLLGVAGVSVVGLLVPAVPLWWVAGYFAVFVAASAVAWAVLEVRVHRAFPPRTLYMVGFDESGVAVPVPVRGRGIDAVMERALAPVLVVVAVGATVACAVLA